MNDLSIIQKTHDLICWYVPGSLTMLPYDSYTSIWGVSTDLTQSFDGDGAALKKVAADTSHGSAEGDVTTTATIYLVRSTVLGGKVVTDISSETGQRGFVYLGSDALAWQLNVGTTESVSVGPYRRGQREFSPDAERRNEQSHAGGRA